MPINLKGRSLDTILNYSIEEVNYLVDLSIDLKKSKQQGLHVNNRPCVGKNIAIMFQKDSTRTRCAFEVAAADLGMSVTYIGPSGSNFGKKESVEDTAKVLGRFYDGIEFRGFYQSDVEALAKYSGVPVWNGLTDAEHPTQLIADYMTMKEHLGDLRGKTVVFAGDIKNNVAVSTMIGAAFMGMNVVMYGPKKYFNEIDKDYMKKATEICKATGGSIAHTEDPKEAMANADVVYTDVWVSLGEPFELFDERIGDLGKFRVDSKLMKLGKPTTIFMHCLPAFHDDHTSFSKEVGETLGKKYPIVAKGEMEVTDEVFQSRQNKAFDQAENRMHSIKAIMLTTIGY